MSWCNFAGAHDTADACRGWLCSTAPAISSISIFSETCSRAMTICLVLDCLALRMVMEAALRFPAAHAVDPVCGRLRKCCFSFDWLHGDCESPCILSRKEL